MKFLKTIRLDPSDARVFHLAAEPDEWAIAGGFSFAGMLEVELIGKQKQAFSNGFLSVESFGYSTFVSVAEMTESEQEIVADKLAFHLMEFYGAPSIEAARQAANQEMTFVFDMCKDNLINTLFTIKRAFNEDGEIEESFRIVDPPGEKAHTRIWEIIEE